MNANDVIIERILELEHAKKILRKFKDMERRLSRNKNVEITKEPIINGIRTTYKKTYGHKTAKKTKERSL